MGVTQENCLLVPGGGGGLRQVKSRRDLGLETSSWHLYTKCSYRMNVSVICCAVHFVEEGQHQRVHTARLGQGGRQSLHFTRNNSTATVEAPLTVPSYEEHIISLICVNHTESMLWPIFVEAGSEPMLIEINKFVVIRHRDMKHEEANIIMEQLYHKGRHRASFVVANDILFSSYTFQTQCWSDKSGHENVSISWWHCWCPCSVRQH